MKNRRVRPVIQTVEFNNYKLDITQSSDCYNGLIYKDGELCACVAAGLSEGVVRLIEKAKEKVKR